MKKAMIMALAAMLCLSLLTACGSEPDPMEPAGQEQQINATQQEEQTTGNAGSEPVTEPVTEPATEPQTEAVTEAQTEPAAETQTEAPTQHVATESESGADGQVDENLMDDNMTDFG